MTLLAVNALAKTFDGILAVDGVSFRVEAGQIVALIGPNGAGKSTCFNMLNGQLRPDAGQILLDGRRVDGKSPEALWRAGIGRGFQVASVFSSMTVLDNARAAVLSGRGQVWRFLRRASNELTEEAASLLVRTGLSGLANRVCGTLSYGDLKRLELALAIANRPKLLLLDEPTAGMTATDRHAVGELIRILVARTGCGVLLTEHDTDLVFALADHVLVLDKGRLIASGAAQAVKADPAVRAAYLGV